VSPNTIESTTGTGMSSTIKIQYSLNLPEGVNTENKSTSKTYQFKIDTTPSSNDSDNQEAKKSYYYDALRIALEEARNQIGDELTAWRDCVGKKELNKELRKGNGYDEEEEEEEEGSS
jgi:hypothetical protein